VKKSEKVLRTPNTPEKLVWWEGSAAFKPLISGIVYVKGWFRVASSPTQQVFSQTFTQWRGAVRARLLKSFSCPVGRAGA